MNMYGKHNRNIFMVIANKFMPDFYRFLFIQLLNFHSSMNVHHHKIVHLHNSNCQVYIISCNSVNTAFFLVIIAEILGMNCTGNIQTYGNVLQICRTRETCLTQNCKCPAWDCFMQDTLPDMTSASVLNTVSPWYLM